MGWNDMSKQSELRKRVAHVLACILLATPVAPPVGSATRGARLGSESSPPSVVDPLVGAGVPLPILEGVTWAYFKGNSTPDGGWNEINFNDASWLVGVSGIGYGDGDDAT